MGWFNESTQTETQFPDFVQDSQHWLYDRLNEYTRPRFNNPNGMVAPLSANQNRAFSLAQSYADNAFGGAGGGASGLPSSGPVGINSGAWGRSTTVDPNGFGRWMNPYTDHVGDRTMARLDEGLAKSMADIGAREARSSAFGGVGSGAALERANVLDTYMNTAADTEAQLQSNAWDRAAGLAFQDAGLAENSLARDQQLWLQEAALKDAAANRGLSIAQMGQDQKRNALDYLLQTGGLQQNQAQAEADALRELLSWYGGFIPAVQGTTVKTEDPNWLRTILGGVTSIFGKGLGGGA